MEKKQNSRVRGQRLLKSMIQRLEQQGRLGQEKNYIQHGSTTVFAHSVRVASLSLKLAKRLRLQVDNKALLRGALLHDYFLYDWHIPDEENPHKLHGFYHPGTALRNASREYRLTVREADIIRRHMWPLTVVPPGCREAWIVTAADKWCSLLETLYIYRGHGRVLARLKNY